MSASPQFPPDYHRPPGPREVTRQPVPPRHPWKKAILWILSIAGALILVVLLAVFIALHSRSVHQYVLRTAQEKTSAALGTQVRLDDFSLHFVGVSPVIELYGINIMGASPYSQQVLAQAERLHLAITVTSLLNRKWYIDEITLVRPTIRMLVDANGNSNLPKPPSPGGKKTSSPFDLGVRHARIEQGQLYYNDQKSSLSAELQQIKFYSAYDKGRNAYSGSLSYRNGRLEMQGVAPVPHELNAEFIATPENFTVTRAVLHSEASYLELHANVQDYGGNPKVEAEYRASIDVGALRSALKNQYMPQGVILSSGTLAYASQPNRPFIALARLNGNLSSDKLAVETSAVRQSMSRISAHYKLEAGTLEVSDFHGNVLGGQLTAGLTMRDLAGASRSHLTAVLKSASLKSATALAEPASVQELPATGRINGSADATWGRNLDDLVARLDANVNSQLRGRANQGQLPVNASVHAHYDARTRQLAVNKSFVRTPQTSFTMDGVVSERSRLQIKLQANDLHELETISAVVNPQQPQLGIHGSAVANATVTGSTSNPQIAGELSASDLRVRGTAWRSLRAGWQLSPSQLNIQNGELVPQKQGRIAFGLTAALQRWSLMDTGAFQFSLNGAQVEAGEIARSAGFPDLVSGTLSANISLRGTKQSPAGEGKLALVRGKIQAEPINSLALQFHGNGSELQANLDLRSPAGAAEGMAILHPQQKTYEARLQSDGIKLEQLQNVLNRNLPVKGVVKLNANGRGTFDNPGLNADIEIPQLRLKDQGMSSVRLNLALANHTANCELQSQLLNTSVNGHGTIHLTGDYDTEAVLDTHAIPIEAILAAYASSQPGSLMGQTELHASLRGPLKRKTHLEAHVTIPTLAVQYKNAVQISAVSPIRIDYANGVLEVPRSGLRGTDTDLQFQARVPLTSNAPASMLLQGAVDLKLAEMLDPDISSSGQLKFDINSYGRRTNPDVHGQIRIVDANVATGTVPLGLQNGNGVVTLLQDRIQITQFQGQIGGGPFNASGAVVYKPSLRFDLALDGHDTRLLYENVRATLNTKLALVGGTESAQLRGRVEVTEMQFTPGFDLMHFMGDVGGGGAAPPAAGGFEQDLQLDLGIASSGGVSLVSRTMSLQAAANLRVTGTAAQPVLLGRINLNGGDLIFRGNRYVLQGGTIDFVNRSQIEPVVNVSVNTQIQQYNIQMHFWGPTDHLHTNYSSDPALPPSDIISLLAFGKTEEASAQGQPGNLAAEHAVASQVSSQVTNRVEKVAGISQLSVDPLLGSDQGESPGARITVQQRVTGKIFVTFSTDVTSTQNSVIKLEVQQSPRVSYSGTRDQNGGFGFDRRIHKEW